MAFDRKVELVIGEGGRGLDIADLDIEFKIVRSVAFAENEAEFLIYNAKPETRSKILKKGNSLSFSAGYKDQAFGVIFIGQILEAKSYQDGADMLTKIIATNTSSETKPLSRTLVSLSYEPKTNAKVILNEIAELLGLALIGIDNADLDLPILPNGFSYAGIVRGALQYATNILKSKKLGLYIDNTSLVVYKLDGTSTFTAGYLSYDTGLLSVEKEERSHNDQQRPEDETERNYINFTSLLNPRMKPNGLVEIDTEKLKGVYLIHKIDFEGDNFGGDFVCVGEAVR